MAAAGDSHVNFLSQVEAQKLDEELMGPACGYSIDQLMELAGLSVAQSLWDAYEAPPGRDPLKVLVLAGPGNNGGDGLVAARHLTQFGCECVVWYPKPGKAELLQRLIVQLRTHNVPVVVDLPDPDAFSVVVDAIFGFSFKGEPREPFASALEIVYNSRTPTLAVDVPSGWDVEEGDIRGTGWMPDALVSLTAPKACARKFTGRRHYLGGRFVPTAMMQRLGFVPYRGSNQFCRLH